MRTSEVPLCCSSHVNEGGALMNPDVAVEAIPELLVLESSKGVITVSRL